MLDQRQSSRHRTLLSGRIRIEKLPLWAVDCTVRNMSAQGACVAIPARTLVPDVFDFGVAGSIPRRAKLVWHRDDRAGLALSDRRRTEATYVVQDRRRSAGMPTHS